ncbi:MAG: isoprenylcysteine carboxylmethyltransferase family protein [Paracoccaceae bacterium]
MPSDRPDILFYPPLASVLAPAAAIALEWLAPITFLPAFPSPIALIAGIALLALAGALAIGGTRAFAGAGTNVDPRSPALRLVESGPYRFTRNPMYLGMIVLQLGLALAFSLDWAMIGAAVLWFSLHFGVVRREEAYLSARFGAPYGAYLARTRLWL